MPSSRSLPRCLPVLLGLRRHVEHVVEQLEREPDPVAEAAERLRRELAPPRGERPEPAGGGEQARGLQLAAMQVALDVNAAA